MTKTCLWQDFCQSLASLRPLTQEHYQRDLVQFAQILQFDPQNNQAWCDLGPAQLKLWLRLRAGSGISAKSLQRQISALRRFFGYLLQTQARPDDPTQGLKAPKAPQPLPQPISVDQMQRLLDSPWEDNLESLRDQAIFELLYSAGLRVSEVVNLNLPHLHQMHEGIIQVIAGKGNKDRTALVGRKAQQALNRYLTSRSQWLKPHSPREAVFFGKQGKRLSVRVLEYRLKLRAQKVGLEVDIHPHQLRHACATHLLESSGDIRAVQEVLGHASLTTTQIYTKLDFQHLAQVYDQAHPRAKRQPQFTPTPKESK